ncbi:HbrB-like protein, partial [Microthyrium microscopicum]
GHRPRQHSQGFFEPSLPSANSTNANQQSHNVMATALTTSQMAAQAAMHAQNAQHSRKRSQTLPDPAGAAVQPNGNGQQVPQTARYPLQTERSFNPLPTSQNLRSIDGFLGGHSLAAATAAQVATYPRTPQYSPAPIPERAPPPVPEKDQKPNKEKSKMKLFSKPKSIALHKDKAEIDRKFPALPSPSKMSLYSNSNMKLSNASTTSLVDSTMSSAASFYSSANASTSTLVPADRAVEREKEKHKHHFLARQKNKLWGQDDAHLPLSSANSISKPVDPNAPQPLYSFAPSSPANPSAFAKSVSGLDLRHGGRALREKKKEDKATSNLSTTTYLDAPSTREREGSMISSEWPISGYGSTVSLPPGTGSTLHADLSFTPAEVAHLGATFGVPGITPDDAWPLLKARLLHIFEGEDPRPPIESFNALVSVHLRRCIQRRAPTMVIEDLTELLQTGFGSLGQTLKVVPDERLVPQLVAMWSLVFNTILPFLQAVFLPLDLEFKGRGPIMSAREAADFWGVALPDTDLGADVNARNVPTLGEELDVRRMILLTFRDTIFLPRYDALMAIFSRLSLESIDGVPRSPQPDDNEPLQPPPPLSDARPGTASSNDIALSSLTSPGSFQSSGTTLLDSSGGASSFSLLDSANRSRATSNTSAGSWASGPGHLTPLQTSLSNHSASNTPLTAFPNGTAHSIHQSNAFAAYLQAQQTILDTGARLTEMVGRMLQCVSVLASVQSGDDKQNMMETLTKTLKYNWLGRGRTGRQRRGFVGTKVR